MNRAVYSALALIVCFGATAGLFFQLGAQFIAAVQVIVYAGAIMVLFLFVIMLLNPGVLERRRIFWWGLGSLAALLLIFVLVSLVSAPPSLVVGRAPTSGSFGSPEMLAQSLFTDFVLPFEIASVLLLVAIIGAVILAKRED